MSSKHLTFRVSMPVFEEIEYLKPKGISMSAFLVELIGRGLKVPKSVYEKRATEEIELNAAFNSRQYEEMTGDEEKNIRAQHNAFQLNQGQLTFNEIIEKHKVELEKKYK